MTTLLATWEQPGQTAVEIGQATLNQGGSLLDALEKGLSACEENPHFIAIGRGSLPNSDGILELDASMMRGDTLQAGAVCGVKDLLPVISLARRVMEDTPHVMLCGDEARRYGLDLGMRPQQLLTDEALRRYAEFLDSPEAGRRYVHTADDQIPHDTVTMLGVQDGKVCAASSTSGMPFKMPGRVGDSPIIGAGIYADDEAGCAGATGWGEELWKACASFRTVEAMKRGLSPQEACEETIRHMHRRHPNGFRLPSVVLAMAPDGRYGAAVGGCEFHLWASQDGVITVQKYESMF